MAKAEITRLTTEQKNAALNAMADALIAGEAEILAANALDLEAAKGTVSDVMLDRLQLTAERIAGMAQGIREEYEWYCAHQEEISRRPLTEYIGTHILP